jgi:hypothetical protein
MTKMQQRLLNNNKKLQESDSSQAQGGRPAIVTIGVPFVDLFQCHPNFWKFLWATRSRETKNFHTNNHESNLRFFRTIGTASYKVGVLVRNEI